MDGATITNILYAHFMYRYVVVMCILVIVAPSIVMGAWSTTFLLGWHVEYYYSDLQFGLLGGPYGEIYENETTLSLCVGLQSVANISTCALNVSFTLHHKEWHCK